MNMPQFTAEAALYPGLLSTFRTRRLAHTPASAGVEPAACFYVPALKRTICTPTPINPCESGATLCFDPQDNFYTCKNLQTDPNNCGTCGNMCPFGANCQGGTCSCPAGFNQIRPPGDVTNFSVCCPEDFQCCSTGSCCPPGDCCCGEVCCTGGTICQNGTCVSCPNGEKNCSCSCKAISDDPNNCGDCGNACVSGETCVNGTCSCSGSTSGGFGGGTCSAGETCLFGQCRGAAGPSGLQCPSSPNYCAADEWCCYVYEFGNSADPGGCVFLQCGSATSPCPQQQGNVPMECQLAAFRAEIIRCDPTPRPRALRKVASALA